MNVKHVNTRNIITKTKLPSADYTVNPYIGCTHGCVYCYAEFMARFSGHNDEKWCNFLDVKENYDFPTDKFQDKTILIGSATDPYNHFEKQFEKTRSILLHLTDSLAHIEILTKSPIVLRDIDILSRMKNIAVGFSLSVSDEIARITEPAAPLPSERIEAMRVLHSAGIRVFAFISPVFPLFSDYQAIVKSVEKYAAYIGFENLNLRGGFRSRVFALVKEHFPQIFQRFISIYYSKQAFYKYWHTQEREIHEFMQTMKNLPYKMQFFHGDAKKK
ncbi:MAG: radical SAM protein [Treponema sp.]|nr:radical SAM protein [Treponema sp.]